jgi:hypothetical protein
MSLVGLLNFLQTGKLHLARADGFEDSLEGQFGLRAIGPHVSPPPTADHEAAVDRMRAECFLSCWHLSAAESLAMWRLYGQSSHSIAIVSTVSEVMSVANDFCENLEHCGMFGDVIYNDYVDSGRMRVSTVCLPFGYSVLPIPQSVQLLYFKAPAFEFEKEWRLLIWKKRATQSFIRIPIRNIQSFTKKVVISAEAPIWIEETIRQIVHVQFGFKEIAVERSALSVHFTAKT